MSITHTSYSEKWVYMETHREHGKLCINYNPASFIIRLLFVKACRIWFSMWQWTMNPFHPQAYSGMDCFYKHKGSSKQFTFPLFGSFFSIVMFSVFCFVLVCFYFST